MQSHRNLNGRIYYVLPLFLCILMVFLIILGIDGILVFKKKKKRKGFLRYNRQDSKTDEHKTKTKTKTRKKKKNEEKEKK